MKSTVKYGGLVFDQDRVLLSALLGKVRMTSAGGHVPSGMDSR